MIESGGTGCRLQHFDIEEHIFQLAVFAHYRFFKHPFFSITAFDGYFFAGFVFGFHFNFNAFQTELRKSFAFGEFYR